LRIIPRVREMLGAVSPGGIPPERRSAASSKATRLSGLVETGGGGATATPEAYGPAG